ncbi:class I SAM-dependent methyltransferase [bacterium]|nr:MAG: class I SAM-dependent methyltransferase [bacterium]
MNAKNKVNEYKDFYEREYHPKVTNPAVRPEDYPFYPELKRFVDDFNLSDKKVLEIGSGGGQFQDIVPNYTGLDITEDLRKFYHKPFFIDKTGEKYPFEDGTFDAIFSISVFEHIPDIDNALHESLRVLKENGVLFLKPAWQVRPWAAEGYAVRSYGDFGLWGKLIKFSILWRDTIAFRLLYIVPKRIWRLVRFLLNGRKTEELDYRKLKANYDKFWDPDSDACNSIDPHAMILWFLGHDCEVLSYSNLLAAFFVKSKPLIIKKKID